ncbi:ATP-dependent dethiobiotin synthetase BioD [Sphingomonas koreensis]|uniref:dethiobiotin synthase n=1 Tax=Sphingomonas koreensis TaxID=93064 RepID=UPI00083638D6|nr:dethiobiotin synthase [Sphingomonas koreensis]PJI90339.1 dethiobiotin synthetase [Sphingomonas koreensis]RSU61194.1 ATP-dependent dethiobiotin synthetase BioD [Sphingomonas koreensis]RSU69837.1 ATP-dependent dethiobiotin synthetase BioD [Sphingomonas koreensis]
MIVVTGTDTGVGKTVAAAALAWRLGASYWKPVQAGLDEETDSEVVARLASVEVLPEAYRLTTPCSPHRAAEIDGATIDLDRLSPPPGRLVIEGAGGALVPLTRDLVYADIFARWGLPVVVVARTTLGTINHTLLTVEALRARSIWVGGILFSGNAMPDSEATICAMGKVRSLGRIPVLDPLTPERLRTAAQALDLADLA